MIFICEKVENIVEKGENAYIQYFPFLSPANTWRG